MKKLLLVSLFIFVLPGYAWSNPLPSSWIGLSASTEGSGYYLVDTEEGEINVYVIHGIMFDHRYDAVGSRFAAPKPECFNATYLGDVTVFPATTGNSQTGVTIMYDDCKTESVHILTIRYYTYGNTGQCCWYWPKPDPASPAGSIEAYRCGIVPGPDRENTMFSIINNDPYNGCIYPVEPSTWGKVKALYQ